MVVLAINVALTATRSLHTALTGNTLYKVPFKHLLLAVIPRPISALDDTTPL